VPREIGRDDVRCLRAAGAQIIEVLPRPEFEEEHIAGAINLPLKELNRETAKILRRDVPIVVYCSDYQ
jgi:rhodanese-related sulfurtransferase